ncbi:kinesin-like protein [Elysia marginata]|uniref:Kinesin-like protein n=1 Tax=Elysia marginata TaxID=1093978 RepID=A0AAV4JLQ6_9GAST|nr:kinesin-like protein [Elysia marginata]
MIQFFFYLNLIKQRKPLASNRKIPVPQSRVVTKRTRSPNADELQKEGKRPCTSNLSRGSSTTALTKQTATSTSSRLTTTKSSSNLMGRKPLSRPAVSHTAAASRAVKSNVRAGAATAPRPVQSRPTASKPSNLNSTVLSTGAPKTKPRPAWDIKGRLQDMQGELSGCTFRIAHLESLNQKLSGDAEEKHLASQSAVKEIQELKEKLSNAGQEYESQKRKLQTDLDDLELQKSSIERKKSALEEELANSSNQVTRLQQLAEVRNKTIDDLNLAIEQKESEILRLEAKGRAHETERRRLNDEIDDWKQRFEAHSKTIEELKEMVEQKNSVIEGLESKERAHETERRRLHNLVQELKGNIRVFCRVRPLLGEEELLKGGIISHMNFPDQDSKVLELDKLPDISMNESVLNSTRGGRGLSKYEFSFDKVFQPESCQAEVFEEISQLVQGSRAGMEFQEAWKNPGICFNP